MSEKKSNMPMIIAGFVIIALAAFFGISQSNQQNQPNVTAEAPSPEQSMENAKQAAGESIEKAKEAANEFGNAATQQANEAAEKAKDAVDSFSAESNSQLAPAAGAPQTTPSPESQPANQ